MGLHVCRNNAGQAICVSGWISIEWKNKTPHHIDINIPDLLSAVQGLKRNSDIDLIMQAVFGGLFPMRQQRGVNLVGARGGVQSDDVSRTSVDMVRQRQSMIKVKFL